MKYLIKVLSLLMMIALNNFIVTYKITNSNLSLRMKRYKASKNVNVHTNKIKTQKSKTKFIGTIIMSLTIVFFVITKIASYVQLRYMKKRKAVIEEEIQLIQEGKSNIEKKNVEICSSIKLISESNKFISLASRMKASYFYAFLEFRASEEGQNRCGIKKGDKYFCDAMKDYAKNVGSDILKYKKLYSKNIDLLDDISEAACKSPDSIAEFGEKLDQLDKDLDELNDEIKEERMDFYNIIGVFGSASAAFSSFKKDDADWGKWNYAEPAKGFEDVIKENEGKVEFASTVSNEAYSLIVEDGSEIKDKYNEFSDKRKEEKEKERYKSRIKAAQERFSIIDKDYAEFITEQERKDQENKKKLDDQDLDKKRESSIKKIKTSRTLISLIKKAFSILKSFDAASGFPVFATIDAILNVIIAALDFSVAIKEYNSLSQQDIHDKTPNYKNKRKEMYSKLLDLIIAVMDIFFNQFSQIIKDGIKMIVKIYAAWTAYNNYKNQLEEKKYYTDEISIEEKRIDETNKYYKCYANHVSYVNIFNMMKDLVDMEIKMLDISKFSEKAQREEDITINNIFESLVRSNDNVKQIIKKEILDICEENVQFCSKTISKKLFDDLNIQIEDKVIEDLRYAASHGPYSKFVTAQNSDEVNAFLDLGYEIIAPTDIFNPSNDAKTFLMGCRLCSSKYVIRHVQPTKNPKENEITLARKFMGKCLEDNSTDPNSINICRSIYGDGNCLTDEYKTLAISDGQFLKIENILKDNAIDQKYLPSLQRFIYFKSLDKDPIYHSITSIWDIENKKWINHKDYLTITNDRKKIFNTRLINTCSTVVYDINSKNFIDNKENLNIYKIKYECTLEENPKLIDINQIYPVTINSYDDIYYDVLLSQTEFNRLKDLKLKNSNCLSKPNENYLLPTDINNKKGVFIFHVNPYENKSKDDLLKIDKYTLINWTNYTNEQANKKLIMSYIPKFVSEESNIIENEYNKLMNSCDDICKLKMNNISECEYEKINSYNKNEATNFDLNNLNISKIELENYKKRIIKFDFVNNKSTIKFDNINIDNYSNYLFVKLKPDPSKDYTKILIEKISLNQNNEYNSNEVEIYKFTYLDNKFDINNHIKTNNISDFIVHNLEDIHDLIIITLFKNDYFLDSKKVVINDENFKNYFNDFVCVYYMKQNYLIYKDMTKKNKSNFNSYIFIKPLNSFGLVPYVDSHQKLGLFHLMFYSECENHILSSSSRFYNRIFLDMRNNISESLRSEKLPQIDKYHSYLKLKILREIIHDDHDEKYQPFDIINSLYQINKKSMEVIKNCIHKSSDKDFSIIYPVKFRDINSNSKDFYRKISISDNNIISEETSNIGPGIRDIYWVMITSNKNYYNESINSQNFLNNAFNYGYTKLKRLVLSNIKGLESEDRIYVTVFVAYDYRLKYDPSLTCDMCIKMNESVKLLNDNLKQEKIKFNLIQEKKRREEEERKKKEEQERIRLEEEKIKADKLLKLKSENKQFSLFYEKIITQTDLYKDQTCKAKANSSLQDKYNLNKHLVLTKNKYYDMTNAIKYVRINNNKFCNNYSFESKSLFKTLDYYDDEIVDLNEIDFKDIPIEDNLFLSFFTEKRKLYSNQYFADHIWSKLINHYNTNIDNKNSNQIKSELYEFDPIYFTNIIYSIIDIDSSIKEYQVLDKMLSNKSLYLNEFYNDLFYDPNTQIMAVGYKIKDINEYNLLYEYRDRKIINISPFNRIHDLEDLNLYVFSIMTYRNRKVFFDEYIEMFYENLYKWIGSNKLDSYFKFDHILIMERKQENPGYRYDDLIEENVYNNLTSRIHNLIKSKFDEFLSFIKSNESIISNIKSEMKDTIVNELKINAINSDIDNSNLNSKYFYKLHIIKQQDLANIKFENIIRNEFLRNNQLKNHLEKARLYNEKNFWGASLYYYKEHYFIFVLVHNQKRIDIKQKHKHK